MEADPTPIIFLSTFLLCCCCCGGALLAGGIGGFLFMQNRNKASQPNVVEGTVTRSEVVNPDPAPAAPPAAPPPVNLEPEATRMAAPPVSPEPPATPEPPAPEASPFPQTLVAQPIVTPEPPAPALAEEATQLAAPPADPNATRVAAAPATPGDDIGAVLLRLNRADRPYHISRDDTRIRVDVPSANYVLSISFLYEDKLARFVTINAATGSSAEVDTAQADVRRVLETFGWQVRE